MRQDIRVIDLAYAEPEVAMQQVCERTNERAFERSIMPLCLR